MTEGVPIRPEDLGMNTEDKPESIPDAQGSDPKATISEELSPNFTELPDIPEVQEKETLVEIVKKILLAKNVPVSVREMRAIAHGASSKVSEEIEEIRKAAIELGLKPLRISRVAVAKLEALKKIVELEWEKANQGSGVIVYATNILLERAVEAWVEDNLACGRATHPGEYFQQTVESTDELDKALEWFNQQPTPDAQELFVPFDELSAQHKIIAIIALKQSISLQELQKWIKVLQIIPDHIPDGDEIKTMVEKYGIESRSKYMLIRREAEWEKEIEDYKESIGEDVNELYNGVPPESYVMSLQIYYDESGEPISSTQQLKNITNEKIIKLAYSKKLLMDFKEASADTILEFGGNPILLHIMDIDIKELKAKLEG